MAAQGVDTDDAYEAVIKDDCLDDEQVNRNIAFRSRTVEVRRIIGLFVPALTGASVAELVQLPCSLPAINPFSIAGCRNC